MEPVNLFRLASDHNKWLSERQLAIATNVAHVDTPNYRSQDVAPFAQSMEQARMGMSVRHSNHISAPRQASGSVIEREPEGDPLTKHGGNTVSIDRELLKAQSVRKSFSLNAAIVKTFHSMIIASTRG